jgi:membrane protease subunit HflC
MMDTLPQAPPHAHDDHDHHDHGLFGHHHHDHDDDGQPASPRDTFRLWTRFGVAGLVVAGAVLAACAIMVGAGQAVVVTQFGRPIRVLTTPGLAWKMPAPVQTTITVDLRLRTTSSGLQDVGTRDGLRILVQAFAAWRVPAERAGI